MLKGISMLKKILLITSSLISLNAFALSEGQFPLNGITVTLGQTTFEELKPWLKKNNVHESLYNGSIYKGWVSSRSSPYEEIHLEIKYLNQRFVISAINLRFRDAVLLKKTVKQLKTSLKECKQTGIFTVSNDSYDFIYPARRPLEVFLAFSDPLSSKDDLSLELRMNNVNSSYEYISADPEKRSVKVGALQVGHSDSKQVEKLLSSCVNKTCSYYKAYDPIGGLTYFYSGIVFGFEGEKEGFISIKPKDIDKVSHVYIEMNGSAIYSKLKKKMAAKYIMLPSKEVYKTTFMPHRIFFDKKHRESPIGPYVYLESDGIETSLMFVAWNYDKSSLNERVERFREEEKQRRDLDNLL